MKIYINKKLCAKILKLKIHFIKFLLLHENQLINKFIIYFWGVEDDLSLLPWAFWV